METVCNRLSSYLPCYATAYRNGVSPPKIPRTAAQASQGLSCLIKFFRHLNSVEFWLMGIRFNP
jgi:hypothetical protein